jgi:hypothetical protein
MTTTTLTKTDDLKTLAESVNQHHRECEQAARSAIEHAKAAGELLIEAKAQIPHGGWLPWLRENAECSVRMAQNYMTIASSWALIESETNTQRVSYLTISQSLRVLASADPKPGSLWVDQQCPSCGAKMAKTSPQYVTCIECGDCRLYANPDGDSYDREKSFPIIQLRRWWKATPQADREQFAREVMDSDWQAWAAREVSRLDQSVVGAGPPSPA